MKRKAEQELQRAEQKKSKVSDEVVNFWNQLPNAEVIDDILYFSKDGEGPNPFLHPYKNALFLRKAYKDIFDCFNKDITKGTFRFLVLGNPGIGKSSFLFYLLYRLAMEKKTVILRIANKSPEIYCFVGKEVCFSLVYFLLMFSGSGINEPH